MPEGDGRQEADGPEGVRLPPRIRPCLGFYEWLPTEQLDRSGKPLKQPFYLRRRVDPPLALAASYEFWRDDRKRDDAEDASLISYAIITTNAKDDVGRIHDQMPMSVAEDSWQVWLDPTTSADDAAELMASSPTGSLHIYAITKAVNDVKKTVPNCSTHCRSPERISCMYNTRPITRRCDDKRHGAGGVDHAQLGGHSATWGGHSATWDGFGVRAEMGWMRLGVSINPARVELRSRRGTDLTPLFPEVVRSVTVQICDGRYGR